MLPIAPGGGGGRGPGSCKPSGAGDNGVAGAQLLFPGADVPAAGGPPTGADKSCGGGNCGAEPLAGITVLPPEAVPAGGGTRRAAEAGLAGTMPLLRRESELRGVEAGAVEAEAGPGGSVGVPGKPTAGGDVEERRRPGPRERHASHSGVRHPVVISKNKLPKHAAMPSRRSGYPGVQAGLPWPLTRHPWPMMEVPPCLGGKAGVRSEPSVSPRLRRGGAIAAVRRPCKRNRHHPANAGAGKTCQGSTDAESTRRSLLRSWSRGGNGSRRGSWGRSGAATEARTATRYVFRGGHARQLTGQRMGRVRCKILGIMLQIAPAGKGHAAVPRLAPRRHDQSADRTPQSPEPLPDLRSTHAHLPAATAKAAWHCLLSSGPYHSRLWYRLRRLKNLKGFCQKYGPS